VSERDQIFIVLKKYTNDIQKAIYIYIIYIGWRLFIMNEKIALKMNQYSQFLDKNIQSMF